MDTQKIRKALPDFVSKLRKKLTPRVVEALATAGAVVLLAVICGVAISSAGRQNPSDSTAPPVIHNPTGATQNTTAPTEVDLWAGAIPAEEFMDTLWNLVWPEHTADDEMYMKTNTTIESFRTDDVNRYRFKIYYGGYQYQFLLLADTGELYSINVSSIDNEAEVYIAEDVAIQILLLGIGDGNWSAEAILSESENSAYYRIMLSDPATEERLLYDVNAYTGAIMNELQLLGSKAAIELALAQLGISKDADSCYASLFALGGNTYYSISLIDPIAASSFHYVDAYTGELVDSTDFLQLMIYNDMFAKKGSWYNMALSSLYDPPEELNLYLLFRNGFPEESRAPTAAELAALEGWFYTDTEILRLPADKMNDVLTTYFGLTLDEFDETDFEMFTYLPSENCYYSDVRPAEYTEGFCATKVEEQSDGSIDVYYTLQDDDTIYKVRLMPQQDGYQILSNVSHFISQETILETVLRSHGIYDASDVQNLTCEYDDSDKNDLRYHISFTYKDHLFTVSVNASTGEWANSSRTPINQADLIIPDEADIEIIGTTEDGIPIIDNISGDHSSGGFYWDRDGSTVIGVHHGKPEFLAIHKETVTLTHDGKEHTLVFKWCTNAGELGVYRIAYGSSSDLYVSSISGNDQYVCLTVHGDYQSSYTYLFNINTKEIINPLAKADVSQLNSDSIMFVFSPDCKAALLFFADNDFYLNIATGELISLQDATGLENGIGATFVTNDLLEIHDVTMTDEYNGYADCLLYSLTDGSMQTVYTGTPADPLSDYNGMMFFGRLQVHMHNNGLCIIDCLSGSHSKIDLPSCNYIEQFTSDLICIEPFENSNVYLIGPDGSVCHVFTYG